MVTAWIASYEYEDEARRPQHGGRGADWLGPRHYFWKARSVVRGIELRHRTTRDVVGGLRLPQLWGPVERTAIQGRLNWAGYRAARLRGLQEEKEHKCALEDR